jgi:hypothetical protein
MGTRIVLALGFEADADPTKTRSPLRNLKTSPTMRPRRE